VTDEPSDDYFAAVAEVVEAARELDEAKRREAEASEAHIQLHAEMRKAEGSLRKALDN
jgi:Arc/MetJ-type ribon-helix-helix transcriptional regulator